MLDELRLPASEAAAGFPDHPHRGFSTCSIMLSGRMEHKDSAGNAGVIGPGGVQWMRAGRGVIHSEVICGPWSASRSRKRPGNEPANQPLTNYRPLPN
jgi:redox-sensitive bicupin YhaK (pirin superfamily)